MRWMTIFIVDIWFYKGDDEMVVMMANPKINKLIDIFEPYRIFENGEFKLNDEATPEAIEAYKKYKLLLEEENKINEQWLY